MGYCAVLTGRVDCLKGIRGTRQVATAEIQWPEDPTTYPRKPRIMSATVRREGVIGRSLGLRSAINHSKGPCVASLNDPQAQVHTEDTSSGSLSSKDLVDLSANPISGTESCVATQPNIFHSLSFFPPVSIFPPRTRFRVSFSLLFSLLLYKSKYPRSPRSVSRAINCRYELGRGGEGRLSERFTRPYIQSARSTPSCKLLEATWWKIVRPALTRIKHMADQAWHAEKRETFARSHGNWILVSFLSINHD